MIQDWNDKIPSRMTPRRLTREEGETVLVNIVKLFVLEKVDLVPMRKKV